MPVLAATHGPQSLLGGVRLVGLIIGLLLLVAAIRSLFGGGGKKGKRR